MKPISTTIQIVALAACFAAQFHPANVTGMPGSRRAMQNMEVFVDPPARQTIGELAASGRP